MATPQPLMLSKPPKALMESYISDLSDARSLSSLSLSCRAHRDLYRNKLKAKELLHYVLNSSEVNKKRILKLIAAYPSAILTLATGREVYRTKEWSIACKNKRGLTTPLKAAAQCGDMPFVKRMLARVSAHQMPTAILQLQSLKKAGATPKDPHSYTFWGLPELPSAYKAYLGPAPALIATEQWDELEVLGGRLGEAYKNLPWFLLQVFCRPVPHEPLPDFTVEPERVCRLFNGSDLDISSLGDVFCVVLHKGARAGSSWHRCGYYAPSRLGFWLLLDSLAMDSLCKVLTSDLDKIIQSAELSAGVIPAAAEAGSPARPALS